MCHSPLNELCWLQNRSRYYEKRSRYNDIIEWKEYYVCGSNASMYTTPKFWTVIYIWHEMLFRTDVYPFSAERFIISVVSKNSATHLSLTHLVILFFRSPRSWWAQWPHLYSWKPRWIWGRPRQWYRWYRSHGWGYFRWLLKTIIAVTCYTRVYDVAFSPTVTEESKEGGAFINFLKERKEVVQVRNRKSNWEQEMVTMYVYCSPTLTFPHWKTLQ